MKKLILGLLAAFLMSTGLVATISSAPAQAICGNPQYPDCRATVTTLKSSPAGNGPKRRTFTTTVKTVGSNAKPVGTVTFRFKRVGGPAQFATRTVPTSGKIVLARTFNAKGTWNVRVTYNARPNTIFKSSQSPNVQFKVR
ncbi:hypothetical protein [Nocardioides sp.]|uniref:hypothetical protein n=1 Tax=Nocardioides sp. TaxID=35761 RepID=UPI0027252D52|nr:hypothetical protein [Nocardioides sp.]MDO9454951.1 hypothetical protein [Nocardioides sp.]